VLNVRLVRHASGDHIGRLIAGRGPGVHLNARGVAEAEALAQVMAAQALAGHPVDAIYSGPLERAVETAGILGRALGLTAVTSEALDELDFGAWTGRTLASLEGDPAWRAWNEHREATRIPGGELMGEAADRALAELRALALRHPGGTVVAVSHADVIRGVLLRCLGVPLDRVHRLEVAPASVSVVRLYDGVEQVVQVNWTVGAIGAW
jgi:broad specificity phosphatase PhoE